MAHLYQMGTKKYDITGTAGIITHGQLGFEVVLKTIINTATQPGIEAKAVVIPTILSFVILVNRFKSKYAIIPTSVVMAKYR